MILTPLAVKTLYGAGASILAAVIVAVGKGMFSTYSKAKRTFRQFTDMSTNVEELKTNHLPHIQTAIEDHNKSLLEIKGSLDVMDSKLEGYSEQLKDNKTSVSNLHTAFLQHLENSRETKRTRKRHAV